MGIITAYANDHRYTATYFFVGKLDDSDLFFFTKGRGFAGGAEGNHVFHAAVDDVIDHAAQGVEIDFII